MVAVGPFWADDGEDEIDAVALAGRRRVPVFAGEARWAREFAAPRIVGGLRRKLAALPGAGTGDEVALAVCARERVRQVPDGVRVVTAADIFSSDPPTG